MQCYRFRSQWGISPQKKVSPVHWSRKPRGLGTYSLTWSIAYNFLATKLTYQWPPPLLKRNQSTYPYFREFRQGCYQVIPFRAGCKSSWWIWKHQNTQRLNSVAYNLCKTTCSPHHVRRKSPDCHWLGDLRYLTSCQLYGNHWKTSNII